MFSGGPCIDSTRQVPSSSIPGVWGSRPDATCPWLCRSRSSLKEEVPPKKAEETPSKFDALSVSDDRTVSDIT